MSQDTCTLSLSLDQLQRANDRATLGKYLAYDAPDLPEILREEELTNGLLDLLFSQSWREA